jgi:hypothetical protein
VGIEIERRGLGKVSYKLVQRARVLAGRSVRAYIAG